MGLRGDCVVGLRREKGVEKFVIWRILQVIFAGIWGDSAESLCDFRRQRSHFVADESDGRVLVGTWR